MSFKQRILEEGFNSALRTALPIAGAAGLGYLGYEAGNDTGEGMIATAGPLGAGKSAAMELFGAGDNTTPEQEMQKFLTPGQDGSWRGVGEAAGNQMTADGKYLPADTHDRLLGTLRTGGGLAGAGLGLAAGQALAPNKRQR